MSRLLNICETCGTEKEMVIVKDYASNLFPWIKEDKMINKGIIKPCKKCENEL